MKNQPPPTILLVEDNEDDVFIMEQALKESGIDSPLQIVTDGQQAIDYLSGTGQYADRQRCPLPSLVFLDLKLPYVSGFEVLTWIRQQADLDSLVVVILTGSSERKDHDRASALGARSYLVKPPSPKNIKEILSALQNH